MLGTRPELIKASPYIAELARIGELCEVIFTGQRKSEKMLTLLEQLGLLDFVQAVRGIETLRQRHTGVSSSKKRFAVVGDTSSALEGARLASSNGFEVIHLEAGLRLRGMLEPEERNRREISQIASYHVAPSEGGATNLRREGVPNHTMIVAEDFSLSSLRYRINRLGWLDYSHLERQQIVLVTVHRASNRARLERVRDFLCAFSNSYVGETVLLARPDRTLSAFYEDLKRLSTTLIVDELEPKAFLRELVASRGVITDSAGVQQEATILGRKVVALRWEVELGKGGRDLMLNGALSAQSAVEFIDTGSGSEAVPSIPDDSDNKVAKAIEFLVAKEP